MDIENDGPLSPDVENFDSDEDNLQETDWGAYQQNQENNQNANEYDNYNAEDYNNENSDVNDDLYNSQNFKNENDYEPGVEDLINDDIDKEYNNDPITNYNEINNVGIINNVNDSSFSKNTYDNDTDFNHYDDNESKIHNSNENIDYKPINDIEDVNKNGDDSDDEVKKWFDDKEISDDDDDDDVNTVRKKAIISDDEESEKGSVVGGLITDIFGSSDEDEEFEGFGEADLSTNIIEKDKKKNETEIRTKQDGSDNDDDDAKSQNREGYVCEFDLMLEQRRTEMRGRRRKRKDVDIINDSDDLIDEMLKNMKEAIEADRQLNEAHKPAFKVLKMLPYVKHQLRKVDLHQAFLDSGILSAITDWLAPLPNKALPHLEVRETLLKQLLEFPMISTEGLKMSGLGKAVMYLYKHPKETKINKEMANKLITEWARPVFNQNSDYKNLTREEREQRDYEQLPKKRRISLDNNSSDAKEIEKVLQQDEKVLRPGDPGYIYRARVPAPSNKDYVIRPKWNSDERQRTATNKKSLNKIQKYQRAMIERKKASKIQSAVTISIEGRNMSL